MERPEGDQSDVDSEAVIEALRKALWKEPDDADQENAARVWVEGVDEKGLLMVGVQAGDLTYRVRVPDLPTLVRIAGPPLRPKRDASALQVPYNAKTLAKLPVREVSLESTVCLVCSGPGAQQMDAIESVRGRRLAGAAYTCLGPTVAAQGVQYKAFNEDGVVLRLARTPVSEVAGIGVFDQAGGEGSLEHANGAASDVAAKCFAEAVAEIETGKDPMEALRASVLRASDGIRALGVGAVSTFAGAVIVAGEGAATSTAYVVSVGDSRVLLYDRQGLVRNKTRLHNLGAAVAAGEVPDIPPYLALQYASGLSRGLGTADDTPDLEVWQLQPGERIAVISDGIGDARELEEMPKGVWHADRCSEDQAKIVGTAQNTPDAVMALVGYALDQMADRYGKPDNIAVAVVEML